MFYLKVDSEYNIIELSAGEKPNNSFVEITLEEFKQVNLYSKFNPTTKEFSEAVEATQEDERISSKERIEQLEETVGILAEQLAKQTLGM